MQLYCTSENDGPSWTVTRTPRIIYIGPRLDHAIAAVGNFTKNEMEFRLGDDLKHGYSALPLSVDFDILHYYMADGFWKTVVKFEMGR